MTTTTTKKMDQAMTMAAEYRREAQRGVGSSDARMIQLRATIEELVGYYDASSKFRLPAPVVEAMGLTAERETAPRYAAIDGSDPCSGAVYGFGATPEAAVADARTQARDPEGEYRAVPISADAYAWVQIHGGAPSPRLSVSSRSGVSLREEE
jgi:hypothetical protein